MDDSSVVWNTELKLSQPTLADGEIHFSAFGPGWGFCSYAVPAGVAMQCLGAKDRSASQLRLAFQLNRERIIATVAEGSVRDPGMRVILSNV
ncbi:conserved hypothetical protein [Paraburkholderia sacchari]|uniref:hypothetical protein n=1 Tax=Paraburkholderia sacchari TaxID=159450 RepID=UPI0039A51FBD